MIAAKLKLAIGAIAVAGTAAAFVNQQHVQTRLRAQNQSLQRQVAQLQTDNESLSNRQADAGGAQKLSDDQFNELLRLRGEVGMLRQQTNELAKLREQNQKRQRMATRLQALNGQTDSSGPLAKFRANETQLYDTMAEVCLADRIYAGDNNQQCASSFDQMKDVLGNLYNSSLLVGIEIVNAGIANQQYPFMITFRERNPRQLPDGTWHRLYGLVDGSVQTAISSNGNFDAYEKYDATVKGTFFSPSNQKQ